MDVKYNTGKTKSEGNLKHNPRRIFGPQNTIITFKL
jgi:hypothetical protein